MSIKVKGFLKDVGGASRVTALRQSSIDQASAVPNPVDPIRNLADQLHPKHMQFRVIDIKDASPNSKTFRFESVDGHIPVFQAGQYVNFRFEIDGSTLSRPFSISSAPYEARGEHPFFEITVRRNRSYFVPDYLFEHVSVGSVLEGALPFGTFYWEPLRDSTEIVALAGGVGITPFYSLAKEIAHAVANEPTGEEAKLAAAGVKTLRDCHLTILYGSVKQDDIVLKDALDEIEKACPDHVKVVHVLSDEPDWPGEKGFVSREIIEKYSAPGCTYLFCGPYPMYTFITKVMEEMGISGKRFRHDAVGNPADVTKLAGYPAGKEKETYHITVCRGLEETVIEAAGTEPVAVALERAAIKIDTHCRNGECGFCRSELLEGEVFVSPVGDGRRLMDKEMGWFHPCSSWPLSDLKIKIPIM